MLEDLGCSSCSSRGEARLVPVSPFLQAVASSLVTWNTTLLSEEETATTRPPAPGRGDSSASWLVTEACSTDTLAVLGARRARSRGSRRRPQSPLARQWLTHLGREVWRRGQQVQQRAGGVSRWFRCIRVIY